MDIFEWVRAELSLKRVDSAELVYDAMESQSGRCLPFLYVPFDPQNKSHWCDRGAAFDFVKCIGSGRILDFGPGDGWPSLIIAPYVASVTGIDSSKRRVDTCIENARKLNIVNASFAHVRSGNPLPFDNETFDGIAAASSIEQSPDPVFALGELNRVLKKRGRLRMTYEGLEQYRGGNERDIWLFDTISGTGRLIISERLIDREEAVQYALDFDLSGQKVAEYFDHPGDAPDYSKITTKRLHAIKDHIIRAYECTLWHPSCTTWIKLLKEAGFSKVMPTRNGCEYAIKVFNETGPDKRPKSLNDIDELIRPGVEDACKAEMPPVDDPWLTAVK